MTTTPSPELPDLDRDHLDYLERVARAATKGPWDTHPITDDELYPRGLAITAAGGETISDEDTGPGDDDAAFIAAATPAAVLALIEMARRAQPEGEAPQAEPGMLANPRLPQQLRNMASGSTGASAQLMREAAAAIELLAPTAAQHAESGAQACGAYECRAGRQDGILCGEDGCDIALGVRAAQSQGAKRPPTDDEALVMEAYDHGQFNAERGMAREVRAALFRMLEVRYKELYGCTTERADQQAAAPGALNNPRLAQQLRNMASGSTGVAASLMREAATALDRLTAPSAPGTPEAPADLDLSRITSVVLQDRGSKSVIVRFGQSMAAATKFLDQFGTLVLSQRAAQLDGGQGEGRKA